jgi:hypothetical protein
MADLTLSKIAKPANHSIVTGVFPNARDQEENQAKTKANPGQAVEPPEARPNQMAAIKRHSIPVKSSRST